MKNILNKLISSFCILLLSVFSTNGQTNVSGTIDVSTTWTQINSPYIVVDTATITSGATLTIEPGVIVKFELGKSLILKDATLNALGNSIDSISFTSNLTNPISNSWQGITATTSFDSSIFNYCNFYYANCAIAAQSNFSSGGYISIKNCYFNNNTNGIYNTDFTSAKFFIDSSTFQNNSTWGINLSTLIGSLNIKNSKIINNNGGIRLAAHSKMENCIINFNRDGVFLYTNYDTIINCEIKNNRNIGITLWEYIQPSTQISNNEIENNKIGCQYKGTLAPSNTIFTCNRICNDTTYDVDFIGSSQDINLINNYWCTSDTSVIASHIHDGHDDPTLSFVNFIPFDTLQCYLINSILKNELDNSIFEIFPNPVSDYFKLKTTVLNSTFNLKIFNVYGELEYCYALKNNDEKINVSSLSSGIHFLQLRFKDKIMVRKFLKL